MSKKIIDDCKLILMGFLLVVINSCVSLPINDKISDVSKFLYMEEDGELEPLIGYSISEYANLGNQTVTDFNGNFKLEMTTDTALLFLSGFYNPILLEVEENTDPIILNRAVSKKSEKLWKKIIK